jgi:hypothetical protein
MVWVSRSVAAVLLGAMATAVTGCGTTTAVTGGGQITADDSTTQTCRLPTLTEPDQAPAMQRLAGPAVTALRGGAASHGFSLDGGSLSIEPPPAGVVPRVSRTQAECEALAAIDGNGYQFNVLAGESGLAIGYATVTVSAQLPVNSNSWQSYLVNETGPHAVPAPASYRDRLAWVMVVRPELVASCPAMASTTPPASQKTPPAPQTTPLAPQKAQPTHTGYGYEVFLIDATTGGDALIYNETEPSPCGEPGDMPANVAVPIEEMSVPWTLDQRNPNKYSAVLTADVPACDLYDPNVSVVPGTGLVRVLAYGQVAPRCGQPSPVTVYLQAAGVTHDLPPVLDHAATGLYIQGTGSNGPPESSGPPTGTLTLLTPTESGKTITIHVGDVLAPPLMFPGEQPMTAKPVRSSDPAVLGPLNPHPQPVAFEEFRAWRPGRATLIAPVGNWEVHVIVLAD